MTTRKKYTYKAAWVAFAEKGDFAKMNKLRAIINKKTATSPTERAVVSTIVQHLFEEKNERRLLKRKQKRLRNSPNSRSEWPNLKQRRGRRKS
jgi:hypothetical protein